MRQAKRLCGLVLLGAITGLIAQDAPPAPETAKRGVLIGSDDTVTIHALNCDEISKPWRVGTSGELNLPLIGRVEAAGLTVEQLEQKLTEKLRKYLLDPQVTVFVTEFRSQPVTVTGAVAKPGIYQLEGPKTLFDVLVMAGGPRESTRTVTIKRNTERGELNFPGVLQSKDGTYVTLDLNLTEVMQGRTDPANIPILPNDLITVAAAQSQRLVHITGGVNRPGSVELVSQDAVSLMKVMAVAGGLTPTANGSHTMIMHINDAGIQTSTAFVDVNSILKGKVKDLELTAGDVVVVPNSQFKTYLHAGATAVLTGGVYTVLARF